MIATPEIHLAVCVGNAYRSQMFEAFFNHYNTNPRRVAMSAGIFPLEVLPNGVVALMMERGVDISYQHPKLLTEELTARACRVYDLFGGLKPELYGISEDKVIRMPVEDPLMQPPEVKRKIRDTIEDRVMRILREFDKANDLAKTI